MDAKCALVLSMTNVAGPSGAFQVDFVTSAPPAPRAGSPLHWDSFIHRICEVYSGRY